jgi:hypothetical protein
MESCICNSSRYRRSGIKLKAVEEVILLSEFRLGDYARLTINVLNIELASNASERLISALSQKKQSTRSCKLSQDTELRAVRKESKMSIFTFKLISKHVRDSGKANVKRFGFRLLGNLEMIAVVVLTRFLCFCSSSAVAQYIKARVC